MAETSKARFIKPDRQLKERANAPGGITPDEAVRSAKKIVAEERVNYGMRLKLDLRRLVTAFKAGPVDQQRDALVEIAKEIRSLAGTLGYDAAARVADSLVGYLQNVPDREPYLSELVQSHIDGLRHVADKGVEDEGGQHEQLLIASLRAAVKRRKLKTGA